MKKKLILLFIFVLSIFLGIDGVGADDEITMTHMGQSVKLNDDVTAWASTSGTTFFCLDKGKHMSGGNADNEVVLTYDSGDTDASKYKCAIKQLYQTSYTSIAFDEFVRQLNSGGLTDNQDEFIAAQNSIWNANVTAPSCGDLTIRSATSIATRTISINHSAPEIYGNYYVIEITVNKIGIENNYAIVLNGPSGTIVSDSKTAYPVNKSDSSSGKLYIYVPRNLKEPEEISLQLTGAEYIKESGTTYTPSFKIYKLESVPEHFKNLGGNWETVEGWQRLGKIDVDTDTYSISDKIDSNTEVFQINACDLELSKIKSEYSSSALDFKVALVDLYKKLGSGDRYKGLLNFSNPTCGGTTCSAKKDSGCLYADFSKSSVFNDENISCYDEVIQDGTNTGYCRTQFTYTSDLFPNIYRLYSGRIFAHSNMPSVLGTGKLVKTCYFYGGTNLPDTIVSNGYSSYIGDMTFNDKLVDMGDVVGPTTLVKKGDYWYEMIQTADYSLPAIYALKGSGKVTKSDDTYLTERDCKISMDGKTYSSCKFLGYGIISSFGDSGEMEMPFSIKLQGSLQGLTSDNTISGTCPYTSEEQIIKKKIKNRKLQLVFRTIDTTNPFPGKLGGIRTKVGSNWHGYDRSGVLIKNGDPSKNDTIKQYAVDRNNSYNKNGIGAKYTITLTPSDIRTIRKYNKETPYDDYTLYCDTDGYNCKSKFLNSLERGVLYFSGDLIGEFSNANLIEIDENIVLN